MAQKLVCWNCGASLADIPLPISRHANCPGCFEVIHCCRMCRHYDALRPGQCSHERADPPVIKESANFCDYFRPAAHRFSAATARQQDAARERLDALFGGESSGDEPENVKDRGDSIRSKLDNLFED